jgi:hypothetical protein
MSWRRILSFAESRPVGLLPGCGARRKRALRDLRSWKFLLLMALATSSAAPALAQNVPASSGSASIGTATSDVPIPDLSGIWGRNFLTFEPPPSGPSPIVSKLRRPDGTTVFSAVGDYTNPILRPQSADVVRKNGDTELGGVALANPHNQCWPEPTPFLLGIQMGMQLIQQNDQVILLYVSNNQVRRVRMNVPHSPSPKPSWQGDSVGHYEGDTLVIDTVGQRVGPLSMVDRYGTPFSAALHVIERYRLIDGALAHDFQRKHEGTYFGAGGSSPLSNEYGRGSIDPDTMKPGLRVEIIVDDPDVFTTPWSAVVTYRHVQGECPEAACAENMRGAGTSWATLVPEADGVDF